MSYDNQVVKERSNSPFEDLLNKFRDQNNDLENLVGRISILGHRVSDTNQPEGKGLTAGNQPPILPFNHGHLMQLHDCLNGESYLIQRLREQVEKLEQLV